MSSTLAWYNSGLGTKTGTAVGNFFTDYKTLFDSKAADPNFLWEVAASSLAGTPYYLWLRPKSGAAGRILLISWTSAPAGNNSAILDVAPTTNGVYVAWFPNGTAASPSNLTASSGTISGDDTNCVKVACHAINLSSIYGGSVQPYYFECEAGIAFCSGNPAATAQYMCAAGDLVVDANDVAYGITIGYLGTSMTSFADGSSPALVWSAAAISAGSGAAGMKSNYATQASGVTWFPGFIPSGTLCKTAIGATDVLTDTTNSDAWFIPVQLVANGIKGGGFPIKLRQIAYGPGSQGQFTVYNITGPVVAARNMSSYTTPNTGYPWFVNFKI